MIIFCNCSFLNNFFLFRCFFHCFGINTYRHVDHITFLHFDFRFSGFYNFGIFNVKVNNRYLVDDHERFRHLALCMYRKILIFTPRTWYSTTASNVVSFKYGVPTSTVSPSTIMSTLSKTIFSSF